MRSTKPEIEVLMATWNGERFLEEQLDSLFAQTFQDFRLVVRDDTSSDSTMEILERYRSRYPERIEIRKNASRLGACGSFSLLAQESVASYVAFCDQDDIWRKDKLEITFDAMQAVERERGVDVPAMVFTDVTLIEEDGRVVASSLWKLAHVNPEGAKLGNLLVQNLVSGCTALANRSLMVKGCPIPSEAAMHDSWLALVACAFGILRPLQERTVQYRQHAGNAVGAGRGWRFGDVVKRLRHDERFDGEMNLSRRQSKRFAAIYADQLTALQKQQVEAWQRSRELPTLIRHWTLYRVGLRRTSFLNTLGFLARI